ncbi:MacB family efflux pump subunit [Thalassobaculum sp. OXR-137]|uniref:MacB family efflux pump subunit n=1 Tax=Thalassobaculum sp. OXR-137 TaxID=3100173 RepID=UPI0039FD0630
MTDVPLLSFRGVGKRYPSGAGEVVALDAIDLDIHDGEFVAIIGQSGSGKSTLMHILGCLDRPSRGTYAVRGIEVDDLDADELASLRRDVFGFVFQRYNLISTLSAAENVELPAIYAGRSRDNREERADDLLGRLGLGDRGHHRPSQLSGGQQQRASIARALMNDPAVILADEPTGALDSRSGAEVLDMLERLNGEGRTVVMITHDPSVAARAHRVIRLLDGRIVEDTGRVDPDRPGAAADAAGWRPAGSSLATLPEAVRMSLRSLRANLFRSALTLLGVVIGVAAVVTMLAVGEGSRADVLGRIQSMGTNLLLIRPGAPGVRGDGDTATLVTADAEALRGVAGVAAVSPEKRGSSTMRFGNVDYRASVQGVWPDYASARDWSMESGGFITAADVDSYAPVAVLGRTVVDNLFPNGDEPIGTYILIGNIPFEVVGVLSAKGATPFGSDQDDTVLVPLTTGAMRIFGQPHLDTITVKVADLDTMDATEQAVKDLLFARHRAEDFRVRNTASLIETVEQTQDTLTILLGSVAAISLLVGGIGVMNIMLVSVTERTREIGVRMATGARMRDIMIQFNVEALIVCGIGGLAGVALGIAAGMAASSFGISVVFSTGPAVLAFVCAVTTGLVFGWFPARKAARLEPAVALTVE